MSKHFESTQTRSHSLCVLNTAMAESGVTEESLKTKIREQLQATHVEIEDMSGDCPTTPPCAPSFFYSSAVYFWVLEICS